MATKDLCVCGKLKDIRATQCLDCKNQPPTEKKCNGCDKILPIENFKPRNKRNKLSYRSRCIPCEANYSKDYRNRHRDKVRERKRNYSKKMNPFKKRLKSLKIFSNKFGYNLDDVVDLFLKHNGKCDICGKTAEESKHRNIFLSIDHNHVTGKIRGFLCSGCNGAIGMFEENPQLLNKAINYLQHHKLDEKGVYPINPLTLN